MRRRVMNNLFINFTNHSSDKWGLKQRKEAEKYGEIIDIPFPAISALAKEKDIQNLAEKYVDLISRFEPRAVLCQGEFCLAYQIISGLRKRGIIVLAACSERYAKESGNKKEVSFVFEQFRRYT